MSNPVQVARSAELFVELCCEYSVVALRALLALFSHPHLLDQILFCDQLKRLLGHYSLVHTPHLALLPALEPPDLSCALLAR